jgi:hypothetical protein
MKKLSLLLVSILCLGVLNAGAQGLIVKAGWNYNKSSVKEIKDGHSGWQAGIGYQTGTAYGFSFQPEILYKVNGLKLSDAADLSLSKIEVPLNLQWGPDLLIARPFILAGPYFGYSFKVKSNVDGIPEEVIKSLNRFDFGVGVGLGINFWKLQIAGKYNWSFGTFANVKSAQDVLAHFDNLKSHPRSFEISVALRF